MLTQCISVPILTTNCVSNVGADAHVDHGEVLHAEVGRLQATNDGKSTTVVYLLADGVQLGAQSRKEEVGLVDLGAVKAKVLMDKVSLCLLHRNDSVVQRCKA